MTRFRPVTDDEWARMSWHARQRWLLAANALRLQLVAELDAVGREHRSRLAHTFGLSVAFDLVVAEGQIDGNARLDEVTAESFPFSTTDHAATA